MTQIPKFPSDGLKTERIALRKATRDDTANLFAYYAANRMHLQPWEPRRLNEFYTHDSIHHRLLQMEQQAESGSALHLLLFAREGDELIGECNFTNIVRGPFQACHLGFSIAAKVEGNGLMYEALTAAIDYAFSRYGLHRIMANYRPENRRSAKLLTRLSFNREGLARSYLKINNEWADHVLTSLINPAE